MAEKTVFLVIKYPRADTAEESLAVLKQLSSENVVTLKDAVAVTMTEQGTIKLHQTKDDLAGEGFLKGGLIGIIFAVLFGPEEWVAVGAQFGPALTRFDPEIKNLLVEEIGEKMSPSESAVVILIEHVDWRKAVARMAEHNFQGTIVVSQVVNEDMSEVEELLEDEKTVASVPDVVVISALLAEAAEALPVTGEQTMVAEAVEEAVPEPAAAEPLVDGEASVENSAFEVTVEEAVTPETLAALEVHRTKKLDDIEGINKSYSQKLSNAGILTVEDLLVKGCSPHGRNEIAKATGISDKHILRWVNMADLYRIKGIGSEYAELLEAAGVDTVPELAHRVPAHLLEKMQAANAKKKLVRRLPVLSQVESWVEQAKSLPRVVTY